MKVEQLLEALRKASVDDAGEVVTGFAAWRAGFRVGPDTLESAIRAGLTGGELAFCFAGAYQSALRCLLPTLPPEAFAALLVSEGKRQRPEELLTTLTPQEGGGYLLDGEKSYVTGSHAADTLLVVARNGVDADGRVRAAMIVVPPVREGVTITERGDMGFLSSLPHARARFERVAIDDSMFLPGDGWRDYARPFRTIEDIHVMAAVAAHAAVHALRRKMPANLLASLVACLQQLSECVLRSPTDPVGHLLLAGAETELQRCAVQINEIVARDDDAFARDWRANHLLVALAGPARSKRLEKAVAMLFSRP